MYSPLCTYIPSKNLVVNAVITIPLYIKFTRTAYYLESIQIILKFKKCFFFNMGNILLVIFPEEAGKCNENDIQYEVKELSLKSDVPIPII